MFPLSEITTLLIDGDGVLWRDDQLLPGVNSFIDSLSNFRINWALLTNNNTRTRQDYVELLRGFGIEANTSMVFTSNTVTISYLEKRFGAGAAIHVVGMDGLKNTMESAGFNVSYGESMPGHDVAAVVAGEDIGINFNKIKVAMRLILGGATFIATNTDSSHPSSDGIKPGTGLVIGALKATTNIEPIVMGKPQEAMYEMAMKRFDSHPENTLMIGDTLETDIFGASRLGICTVLLLTGVSSMNDVELCEIKPDYVFDNLINLQQVLFADL